MSDKKIIAVVGATGAQGGGLVRAIVADSIGALRCTCHHPESGLGQGEGTGGAGRRGRDR